MSRYAKIKKYCISNGEGLRTAIFFTGCDIHCPNCFNKELQDSDYGFLYTKETEEELFNTMNEHISGLSILGGEPFSSYNLDTITELCKHFKEKFPNKTIWIWTGYLYENLKELEIFDYIDVLIDGPFVESLKDYDLKWRGSSNQRILYKGKDF